MTIESKDFPAPFRSKLSYDIFMHKYSHQGCETWEDLCRTLVREVVNGRLDKEDEADLIRYMIEMKFIPGGRYLYYAGRPVKFYNNCGNKKTLLLTKDGLVPMGRYRDGEVIYVYSPVAKTFLPAVMHTHGVQEMFKYTLRSTRGNGRLFDVCFTADHRWPTLNRGTVTDLSVGDIVGVGDVAIEQDDLGFIHGAVFADGNKHVLRSHFGHQLRLCGKKSEYLPLFSGYNTTYPVSAKGDPVVYIKSSVDFKEIPARGCDIGYIKGFLRGWLSFDGSVLPNGRYSLSSTNKEALLYFQENAPLAGLLPTGEIVEVKNKETNYGVRSSALYTLRLCEQTSFEGLKVIEKVSVGYEETYCPLEPVHNRIVTNYGIDTFNCYLLRAEEDTREDWADISWRAESCLLTGGGIGVDYSVYRDSKQTIKRTGGRASGPIPKMYMVNEIGRNVIQGGSRRSAIYASLNWRHGDIERFLTAKDWHNMPIAGTDKTVWDVKVNDFNYPAPLDMTNISVNYDTQWLEEYYRTGEVGEVFLKNVEQALRTGEPGFSFNFYERERETLRNACTEVTSSDDSDVCNLGSINLSRIDDLDELAHVVELATAFLLCGTIEAQLPYDKIRLVREKNRRLGLGIMGLHEWLIQRGYKYEMNDELRKWLHVYKGISDTVSRRVSMALGISTPVANRAIAPTGTIGMLAGTTTGIEPLYAVAYKRRYLVNGNRWKYQYAVDSIAQELIDLYGVDPEKIESAIDLSKDYERRIKLQADVQDYVDMAISSTINLPSKEDQSFSATEFAHTLAQYAPRLRGFTCYPDGSRGGQPLTSVPYTDALERLGEEFDEHLEVNDICVIGGRGGHCGS